MAKKSQGEPHYQVPRELADSLAFRNLPSAAKVLWHDLMMQYHSGNNGNINAVLSELAHYNWRSSTTIAKGLRFLIAHRLIKETRMGGKHAGNLKQCCLYAFTHLPTHANTKLNIQGRGQPMITGILTLIKMLWRRIYRFRK
ncbi:hypothetical protein [Candidatus Nitrotoga sp. AM1P]|uniref:hypothetical protein n=1 Tax=Candidatus Nitrotoga sp. AM1P TaxID=2559597 RepID=UPI0015645A32|nr:hypothetical protein [Candidatus Nitrotoga sp. AM1P]